MPVQDVVDLLVFLRMDNSRGRSKRAFGLIIDEFAALTHKVFQGDNPLASELDEFINIYKVWGRGLHNWDPSVVIAVELEFMPLEEQKELFAQQIKKAWVISVPVMPCSC